jgi:hypothetical protein
MSDKLQERIEFLATVAFAAATFLLAILDALSDEDSNEPDDRDA